MKLQMLGCCEQCDNDIKRGKSMRYNFGDNFKTMRKQRDLTQEVVAEALGVSAQAISK